MPFALPPDEVLEPLLASPGAYVLAFVLGTLFGSFANVCIYRWPPTDEFPDGRSVVMPPSHCFGCKQPVRWYDNVPLLSYLWLRGRCRFCQAEFSPRYLLVEAATGVLFVAVYAFAVDAFWFQPVGLRVMRFAILAAFVFVLVVITFIDLDHKLILDKVTLPAIPIFYGLGLLLPERGWSDGLIGAAVGYGVVRLIADGYYFLTRREGLGYGDGKLLALVGALFGWEAVLMSLFVGSLFGSVIGVAVIVVLRRRQPAAPEGVAGAAEGGAHPPASDQADIPATAAGAGADDAAEHAPDGEADEGLPALRHAELPFGPFLAMGALVYVFVQPWLRFGLVGLFGP
jgi:leader peptidase (prepilin peptidase) / N-methyltransferase